MPTSSGGQPKSPSPSGGVRICAGRWKGRRLEVPADARPTSAMAREALFDLLGPRVEGARFLDLFAGSGAVGIEAVSRGAARAVLVESDASTLRRNLERLGAPPEIAVEERDVAGALGALVTLAARRERFDVVFSDPPYASAHDSGHLSGILPLLSQSGILILQRDAKTPAPAISGLTLLHERAYGRNVFAFFAHGGGGTAREAPDRAE